MRSTMHTLEIQLGVEYSIYPAEKDVGIMHPYVGELYFYSPLTGNYIEPKDIMTQSQIDNLCEELVDYD